MRRIAFMIFLAAAPQLQAQTAPPVAPPAPPPRVVHISIPPEPDRSHDYEDWHVELTGAYWPLTVHGNAKTLGSPADLHDDLGVEGIKSQLFGRISVKPGRKHEWLFEAVPYRINGGTRLTRPLNLVGNSYPIGDEVVTEIKMDSYNAEYRYRFIHRNDGFFAAILGVGYLDARSTFQDVTRSVEESDRARIVFPYLGVAGRRFLNNSYRYNFSGEFKGMNFGNDGHFLDANGGFGFSPNQKVTLGLGYSFVSSSVHNRFETEGVKAGFNGPTFSIQWRDR